MGGSRSPGLGPQAGPLLAAGAAAFERIDDEHFAEDMTLAEAKATLLHTGKLADGLHCPVCRQFAKEYKRKLNTTMVKALGLIYKATAPGLHFAHGPTVLMGSGIFGGDVGKLAYFGLVEEEAAHRPDGGRGGWWRVTPNGRMFLQGIVTVPKYAHVYDGRVLSFSGDPVGIHDVAPAFNYRELMAS